MEKKIFATVKGKEITNLEIEQILRTLPPNQAMQYSSEQGKKQIAKELVDQELFYLDAIENKLENDELFKAELERLKEGLLKQYAVNKLISNVSVSEEEKINYFENNKEQFKKSETANAKHILVDNEEKAKELLEKINSDEITFEECAKKHSTCPSNTQGGDLGEFGKGQMVKEFEDAVFSMKENEVCGPIKTQFGYHIIKLVKINPSISYSYEEVSQNIEQMLTQQKQQKLFDSKLKELYLKYADSIKFED